MAPKNEKHERRMSKLAAIICTVIALIFAMYIGALWASPYNYP